MLAGKKKPEATGNIPPNTKSHATSCDSPHHCKAMVGPENEAFWRAFLGALGGPTLEAYRGIVLQQAVAKKPNIRCPTFQQPDLAAQATLNLAISQFRSFQERDREDAERPLRRRRLN